ncbi:hypothetical protein E5221_10610 [Pseudomonas sp. A2]|nr:hypothetical protein E5221_10610 [Pseudomonas sp. A2]
MPSARRSSRIVDWNRHCRCFCFCFCFASKRTVAQAPPIATSGGRAKGLRREVTGMDARQALRPHGWGLQRVLPGAGP